MSTTTKRNALPPLPVRWGVTPTRKQIVALINLFAEPQFRILAAGLALSPTGWLELWGEYDDKTALDELRTVMDIAARARAAAEMLTTVEARAIVTLSHYAEGRP